MPHIKRVNQIKVVDIHLIFIIFKFCNIILKKISPTFFVLSNRSINVVLVFFM